MKQRTIRNGLMAVLALATIPVAAQPYGDTFTAQARVVSSVPIREAATAPRQECWTEYSDAGSGPNQAAGAVIGGIAGGLIGHQIGSGRGNTAATIAGTVGGALAGNEIARRQGDGRVVERCRTVGDYTEHVVGYDVTYRFQGREFNTRLPYDPGANLPVNVTVTPAQ